MFIFSLPLFFSSMNWVKPFELLVVTLILYAALFFTLPAYENNTRPSFLDNYLFSAWHGQAPLLWAFLPFYLLLNAGLFFADRLAKTGEITVSSWDEIHFVLVLPICWWTLSVWRCCKNSTAPSWQALARLLTLSVYFEFALKLVIRIDYPRLFFACEELMLDYGSCF
jgi:hypothetical protein